MGMGKDMGNVEIDERGRLTIPAKIRESLNIHPGDKLIIKENPDKTITIRKKPTKEEIFKNLVGCIKAPLDEKPTPESIKNIWKMKK